MAKAKLLRIHPEDHNIEDNLSGLLSNGWKVISSYGVQLQGGTPAHYVLLQNDTLDENGEPIPPRRVKARSL